MAKILRASVMRKEEWNKERNQEEWKRTRRQVLKRDNTTCVYCGWQAQRFMQVNHIGAEDNHDLDNLETVCAACHAVLHIGIKSTQGIISAFDCKPELTNMAKIVTIQPGEYRGYLPEGKAILFHQSPPWNGFPERVHMWQLPR